MLCYMYLCIFGGFLFKEIRTTRTLNLGVYVRYESREWSQAVCDKGDSLVGSEVFGECSPETCNASAIADILPKLDLRTYRLWINGYLLWSPLITYNGCFSLKERISSRHSTSSNNSVLECSKFCSSFEDRGYLFLYKEFCKCIAAKKYRAQIGNILQEFTSNCNIACEGNPGYKCGGTSDHGIVYYSVYEIISSYDITTIRQHCASAIGGAFEFDFQDCHEHLPFICEKYSSSSGLFSFNCTSHERSWYNAYRECQEIDELLHPEFDITKTNCLNAGSRYWTGGHVEEKIVWGNDKLPKEGRWGCLALYIDQPKLRYQLSVEKCYNKLPSLCYSTQEPNTDDNFSSIPTGTVVLSVISSLLFLHVLVAVAVVISLWRYKKFHRPISTLRTNVTEEEVPYDGIDYNNMDVIFPVPETPTVVNTDDQRVGVADSRNDASYSLSTDEEGYLNPYQPLTEDWQLSSHVYESTKKPPEYESLNKAQSDDHSYE